MPTSSCLLYLNLKDPPHMRPGTMLTSTPPAATDQTGLQRWPQLTAGQSLQQLCGCMRVTLCQQTKQNPKQQTRKRNHTNNTTTNTSTTLLAAAIDTPQNSTGLDICRDACFFGPFPANCLELYLLSGPQTQNPSSLGIGPHD